MHGPPDLGDHVQHLGNSQLVFALSVLRLPVYPESFRPRAIFMMSYVYPRPTSDDKNSLIWAVLNPRMPGLSQDTKSDIDPFPGVLFDMSQAS